MLAGLSDTKRRNFSKIETAWLAGNAVLIAPVSKANSC
jgi:hypothetical protein